MYMFVGEGKSTGISGSEAKNKDVGAGLVDAPNSGVSQGRGGGGRRGMGWCLRLCRKEVYYGICNRQIVFLLLHRVAEATIWTMKKCGYICNLIATATVSLFCTFCSLSHTVANISIFLSH